MADAKVKALELYGQIDQNREYWGDQVQEMLLKIIEEIEKEDG